MFGRTDGSLMECLVEECGLVEILKYSIEETSVSNIIQTLQEPI